MEYLTNLEDLLVLAEFYHLVFSFWCVVEMKRISGLLYHQYQINYFPLLYYWTRTGWRLSYSENIVWMDVFPEFILGWIRRNSQFCFLQSKIMKNINRMNARIFPQNSMISVIFLQKWQIEARKSKWKFPLIHPKFIPTLSFGGSL